MNMPLPHFNAFDVLRNMEDTQENINTQTLATLATLAETPPVFSSLRDRVLCLTDDDWYEIEERAAILEFDAGMSRKAAEHFAWCDIVSRTIQDNLVQSKQAGGTING